MDFSWTLFLSLILISMTPEVIGMEQVTTQQSIYDAIFELRQHLSKTKQTVTREYWKMVSNDTGLLANWKAYSAILAQINDALFDMAFETLLQNGLTGRLSDDCLESLTEFLYALTRQESWAYKVLDSNGFMSAGFLEGAVANFGDFDECLKARSGRATPGIQGRYCLVKYRIKPPINSTGGSALLAPDMIFNTTDTILESTFFEEFLRHAHYFTVRAARSGLCVPSGCNKTDVQSFIDSLVTVDRFQFEVDTCQTSADIEHFTRLQWIIIVVLSIIFSAVSLVTLIEWCRKDVDSPGFLSKISMRQNLSVLLSYEIKPEELGSLYGLRVITMLWLVYSHAYLLAVKETFRSSNRLIESLFDMKMHFIFNAWPAVDVFFILSALVHSYHIFVTLRAMKPINVLQTLCNRVARLWPALWTIVAVVFVIPNMAQGPLWSEVMEQQAHSCHQNWWSIVTFTANFRPEENLCQIHTWYLAADIQLLASTFVFIIIFYKFRAKAILSISVLNIIVSLGITIYFYQQRFHAMVLVNQVDDRQIYKEMFQIYMPTYLHVTPYMVGILTAYLLVFHKNFKMPKWLHLLWIPSIGSVLVVILSGYLFTAYPELPILLQSVYAGFHRIIWSLSIGFIIFYCETKRNGLVYDFFSAKLFIPIGKLSYLIYLIHFIVTWSRYAYERQPMVYSFYTMLNQFILNLAYSLVLAFVVYLVVEAPAYNLYRSYIGRKRWKYGEFNLAKPEPITNDVDIEDQ